MSDWNRDETELVLSLSAADPDRLYAYTNWPYYRSRIERCEGFEASVDLDGALSGTAPINAERPLSLRKSLATDTAEARYWRERSRLLRLRPEPLERASESNVASDERETVIRAEAADPYWVEISTDMDVWLDQLDNHPYAVVVDELRYEDGSRWRAYALPRKLLEIRPPSFA